jgi:hypothetical protein
MEQLPKKLNEKVEKLKDYFNDVDFLALAETRHGSHSKTISLFLEKFISKIDGVFIELPINYQSSIDRYIKTGEVDESLERFFIGAQGEGKDVRSELLHLFKKCEEFHKSIICIDSSKIPTEEYKNKSKHENYFLKGNSRDEDMFNTIKNYYQEHPGKYLIIAGENHIKKGKHVRSEKDTLGVRLAQLFSNNYKSVLMASGSDKNVNTVDYDDIINPL